MLWALEWVDRSPEDYTKHFIYHDCLPCLFRRRKDAREYAKKEYGYIKHRLDLRRAPHFWRMPRPVKVMVKLQGGE